MGLIASLEGFACALVVYDLRHEKTCLQGFPLGPTQDWTEQPLKMARGLKLLIQRDGAM